KAKGLAALAECRDLEREFRAARPGTRDRVDAHEVRPFPHCSGFQTSDFGLGPPGFTLGLEEPATATCQRNEDDGADNIQTNPTRHARQIRRIYLRTLQRVVFTHL